MTRGWIYVFVYLALMVLCTYLTLAWAVFQLRNPTANEMSFYREFPSVVTFRKLSRYQGK